MSMLDEQLFHVQRVRGAKTGIFANLCLLAWKLCTLGGQGAQELSAALCAAGMNVFLVVICCTMVWLDEPTSSRKLWYFSTPMLSLVVGTNFSTQEEGSHNAPAARLLIVALFTGMAQLAFSGQLSVPFSVAMWVPPLAMMLMLRAMSAVAESDLDDIERTWVQLYSAVEVGLSTLCAGAVALIWLRQPSLLGVLRREQAGGGGMVLPAASVLGRQQPERRRTEVGPPAGDEDEDEEDEWAQSGFNSEETDEIDGAYAASTQSMPSTECPDGSVELELSDCCSD